jgi:N-acetylmuramoyl-L-alanine amidase
MTREDDTFIPLDDRTLIANSKEADLFVSIHVNSHPKRETRGVEIYHLGESSDRHAMAVAARENNVSMQSLGNLERSVKQILFDLGREYKMDQSQTLAHFTRRSFQTTLEKQVGYDVVDHGVKRAPFYVLLNSNMPSILAEVSFISNATEEQLLRQGPYRQAIAESLFQGIRTYLASLKPVS